MKTNNKVNIVNTDENLVAMQCKKILPRCTLEDIYRINYNEVY